MRVSPISRAALAERFFFTIPAIAFAYSAVVLPLSTRFIYASDPSASGPDAAGRLESRLFWPALAATAILLSLRLLRERGRHIFAPHVIVLLCYLALAVATVLWSYDPPTTFRRAVQQVLVVVSVLLPVLLSRKPDDIIRPLFIGMSAAMALNLLFVLTVPPSPIGHAGIYDQKNTLGLVAAIGFVLSLYELTRAPRLSHRLLPLAVLVISLVLAQESSSKTALAMAILAPTIGLILHWGVVALGISPAIMLFYLFALVSSFLFILSDALEFSANSVLVRLFGDETFTGRTLIWDFALSRIDQRPIGGWGYQAFWSTSSGAPSREGPDWVADMPHAHNGYLDAALDTGLIGLSILTAFIILTLHASRSLVRSAPAAGWLAISLVLFSMFYNFMESTLVRSASALWLVLLIMAALAAAEQARTTTRNRSVRTLQGLS